MNKLKGFRASMNITQKEMADKLGMHEVTYAKKEIGKSPITVDEAKKLRQAFNLPIERFVDLFDL